MSEDLNMPAEPTPTTAFTHTAETATGTSQPAENDNEVDACVSRQDDASVVLAPATPVGVVNVMPPFKKAAGILYVTDGGKVLIGRRACPDGDYDQHWGIFGGHHEEGETLEMTAIREFLEETGHSIAIPDGSIEGGVPAPLQSIATTSVNGTEFTYFLHVGPMFDVMINDEHSGFEWVAMGDEGTLGALIPGMLDVMYQPMVVDARKSKMHETDLAKAMAKGALPSPQFFGPLGLFKMRVTGTGTSFRRGDEAKGYKDEYVYRRPETYLNQDFLDRCQGLPVIFEHPVGKTLNSEEYHDRNVGTLVCPYIQGDEVWGVAKILDEATILLLSNEKMSTSPTVVFHDTSVNSTIALNDGSQLLIEGKPSLLDHLAICERGVWDKGGEPSGVESELVRADSVVEPNGEREMSDVENKAAADAAEEKADRADAARADAEPEWAKKIADSIGGLCARMDSIENLVNSKADAKADAAEEVESEKKEGEGDEAAAAAKEEAKPVEAAADKKADSEEEEKEKAMADARADAMSAELAEMRAALAKSTELIASLTKAVHISDDDRAALSSIQARADEVANAFGKRAPAPMAGESSLAYRRRLASQYKGHSSKWAAVDLAGFDDTVLGIVEADVYADALRAASQPADLPAGTLRSIVKKDRTGREITEYVGDMGAWMDQFKSPAQLMVKLDKGAH